MRDRIFRKLSGKTKPTEGHYVFSQDCWTWKVIENESHVNVIELEGKENFTTFSFRCFSDRK